MSVNLYKSQKPLSHCYVSAMAGCIISIIKSRKGNSKVTSAAAIRCPLFFSYFIHGYIIKTQIVYLASHLDFFFHKQSKVSKFKIKYALIAQDTLAHERKINNQFIKWKRMMYVNICMKEGKIDVNFHKWLPRIADCTWAGTPLCP